MVKSPETNKIRKEKEKQDHELHQKKHKWRENNNLKKSEERTKEKPEQAEIRRRNIAEKMATLQNMETPE
jgi:hypothetical protein